MVYFRAYAYPFAERVVVVAGDVGQDGFAGFQAQGVEELGTAEGFADDLGFDGGVVVVDDVVGAQQQVAFTVGVGAGQGAFVQAAEVAQRGVDEDLVAGGAVDRAACCAVWERFQAGFWRAAVADLGGQEDAVADEIGDKAGCGAVVQGVGVVPLVQQAFVHDADDVADGKGFELVVGDEQGGGVGVFEDDAQLVGEAFAQVHIEVGKGLVQQQELRLRCQRPRQGDALLLPAREFMRVAVLGVGQADEVEHFGHARQSLGFGQMGDTKSDVFSHVQVRKQRVVLKHHADAAGLGGDVGINAADDRFGQPDLTRRGALQPGDGAQQGGFAAARGADQHANVASAKAKRHAGHGGGGAVGVLNLELGNL